LLIFVCCLIFTPFTPLLIKASNARFPIFAILQGDL
jgi:hypothetical protein